MVQRIVWKMCLQSGQRYMECDIRKGELSVVSVQKSQCYCNLRCIYCCACLDPYSFTSGDAAIAWNTWNIYILFVGSLNSLIQDFTVSKKKLTDSFGMCPVVRPKTNWFGERKITAYWKVHKNYKFNPNKSRTVSTQEIHFPPRICSEEYRRCWSSIVRSLHYFLSSFHSFDSFLLNTTGGINL